MMQAGAPQPQALPGTDVEYPTQLVPTNAIGVLTQKSEVINGNGSWKTAKYNTSSSIEGNINKGVVVTSGRAQLQYNSLGPSAMHTGSVAPTELGAVNRSILRSHQNNPVMNYSILTNELEHESALEDMHTYFVAFYKRQGMIIQLAEGNPHPHRSSKLKDTQI